MTRQRPITFAILLSVLLIPWVLSAQPTIQGSLSGSLGPGTYIVIGNCTVNTGNTLSIQPGTTFLFAGHYSFKIYGTLSAVGTASDSIVFTRQNPSSTYEWSGIRFMSGAPNNSVLSYCKLEYGKYQVWPDYNGGAICTQNVTINVNHSLIANNYSSAGGGIYASGAAVNLSDCIFYSNSAGNGGGIYLLNCNNSTVTNCLFAKNSATST